MLLPDLSFGLSNLSLQRLTIYHSTALIDGVDQNCAKDHFKFSDVSVANVLNVFHQRPDRIAMRYQHDVLAPK